MKKKLVIAVPTYCESENIARITHLVDQNLNSLSSLYETTILNADNNSPDGTTDIFLSVETKTPQHVIQTDPNHVGKGYNFKKIFEYALRNGVDYLICLDADLEELPDDWIPSYISAIETGHDLVIPLYPRQWYDANLTNQIVVPIVVNGTGNLIRQPIGGDFAFSREAIKHFLKTPWPSGANGYGIDIFLVLTAIAHNLAYKQQPLSGGKIHSWRSNSAREVFGEMARKFEQVVGTLLLLLKSHFPNRPMYSVFGDLPAPPQIGFDPKSDYSWHHLTDAAQLSWENSRSIPQMRELTTDIQSNTYPHFSDLQWGHVLANVIRYNEREKELNSAFFTCLESLFYCRIATSLPLATNNNIEIMTNNVVKQTHFSLTNTP